MSSAENVRRLLQFSADPRSREAVPSREGHAGRRRLKRRTAMEAAAAHPHCQRVIRDFIILTKELDALVRLLQRIAPRLA